MCDTLTPEPGCLQLADVAVTEAQLLIERHECHNGRNDLMALLLHQALCRQGGEYDAGLVHGCLQRLRISAATGRYPREMLRKRLELR